MPIYEYICDTCHDEFEVRRSFSDEGVPPCPHCNGTGQVRRRFSAPAIVFKGSGFYVTDSRGKSSTSKPANRPEKSKNGDSKPAKQEKSPESASAKTETKTSTD